MSSSRTILLENGLRAVVIALLLGLAGPSQAACPPVDAGCVQGQYDMLDYLFSDDPAAANVLRLTTLDGEDCPQGSAQPIRAYCPVDSQPRFYIVKQYPGDDPAGRAYEYEEYRYDDEFIYLIQDTSWQRAEWCKEGGTAYQTSFELWEVDSSTNTASLGGKHFPRCVDAGLTYRFGGQTLISRYEDRAQDSLAPSSLRCTVCGISNNSSRYFRIDHLDSHVFDTGSGSVTLEDLLVVEPLTQGNKAFERYYFSKEHGLVGYEDLVLNKNSKLRTDCAAKIKARFESVASPFEIRANKSCPWIDLDPAPSGVSIASCNGQTAQDAWAIDVRTGVRGRRNTSVQDVSLEDDGGNLWSLTCQPPTAGGVMTNGAVGDGQFSLHASPLPSPTPPRWLSGEVTINGEHIVNLWSEPNQPPSQVQGLQIEIEGLTVRASWDQAYDPEGEDVRYWVVLSSGSALVEEVYQNETTVELPSLTPNREYQLEVRALDPWGQYVEPTPETFYLPGSGAASVFDFADFSILDELVLNGSVLGISNPVDVGGRAGLRLTSTTWQRSSVFFHAPVAIPGHGGPQRFTSMLEFQITNPRGGGADGITWIIASSSSSLGNNGMGIGYSGISPSVVVELDTWSNGGVDDGDANHVGISLDGSIDSVVLQPLPVSLENGHSKYVWIEYDVGTGLLEVRISEEPVRPESPVLSYPVDLEGVFGSEAYFGITSGTGAAAADHIVLSWSLDEQ